VIVELFGIEAGDVMREALAIRTSVFVEEQGVPPEEEIDAHDRTDVSAVHALARLHGRAVGAGRYYIIDAQTVQIGRMAVLAGSRGAGVGSALLAALLRAAGERGFRRAHLHAQQHARAFYARAGFVDDGETLWDAGISHQPMSLEIFSGTKPS